MANGKSISAVVETQNGLKGVLLTMFLPFDGGFTAEKPGNKWLQPVKARDAEGKLLKGGKDGKEQLYMLRNGETSAEFPYTDATKRNIKPEFATEERQATPHIDASMRITPALDVVWPDGLIRDIAVDVKANNPRTAEKAAEEKAQKAATRGKTKADLEQELADMQAKLKAAGLL